MINKNGFTLIEVMVSVVIMSILMAIASPNFRTWMIDSRTYSAAEKMNNMFQLAKSSAIKLGQPVSLTVNPSNGLVSVTNNTSGQLISSSDISITNNTSFNVVPYKISCDTGSSSPVTLSGLTTTFNSRGFTTDYSAYRFLFTASGENKPRFRLDVSNAGATSLCYPNKSDKSPEDCNYIDSQRSKGSPIC